MKPDPVEIARAYDLILDPDQVTELRVLECGTRRETWSGYYSDRTALVEATERLENAKGVYIIPNLVNPALLARAANKSRPIRDREPRTSDNDILLRRWFLVDCDSERPTGISASDREHEAALERADLIKKYLSAAGWPDPIFADSGNGGHLMYRIDLPRQDNGLIKAALEALAFRFDDVSVKVDQTVFNPARIWKVYGTIARKGDDVPERPHRLARILNAPAQPETVSIELLHQLAGSVPEPPYERSRRAKRPAFDVERWIADRGLEVIGPREWQGGRRWIFPVCPWNPDHRDRSAYLLEMLSGAIAAGCHHSSCADKQWSDLRELFESTRPSTGWQTRDREEGDLDNSHRANYSPSPWPDPPADEAFYGLAGDIVRAIEPHSEADRVALLVNLLVAFGNIVGDNPYFRAEADKHFPRLFVALVGQSSKGRKGSSWGHIRRLFEAIQTTWISRTYSGLSSGEGLIHLVRDPVEVQEPVKEKGAVTGYQTVVKDPGVEDKRALIVESELAQVLKVLSREGNTLSPVIRKAWDDGNLQSLTRNSPLRATGAHISIIGHIVADELRRYLDSTEAGNGFANRFLWIAVRRSKALPEGGRIHEVDLDSLIERLRAAVMAAKFVREMQRDEEARAIWWEVYEPLSDGQPGLLGSVTSRAEAQVMRLACIYALLDQSATIRKEHLLAALALWDYALSSARYIFGDQTGDPIADRLLIALRASREGLTRTELNGVLGRHGKAEQIARALASLEALGRARRAIEKTDGRPVERWVAT